MKKFFALAIPLVLLLAGATEAQADKPGTTKISIQSIPSVYGYVTSSRSKLCAGSRTVTVYREKAGEDKKIASTKTRKFRGEWQWSIKEKPNGKIYATSRVKMGCSSGTSKSIRVSPIKSGDISECPAADAHVCHFSKLVFVSDNYCENFDETSDSCDGTITGGPREFNTSQTSNFHWNQYGDSFRGVAYYNGRGYLEGSMPSPTSDRFSIRDAYTPAASSIHMCTPDLPGKDAGQIGGPLKLDFHPNAYTVRVTIEGYMKDTGPPFAC